MKDKSGGSMEPYTDEERAFLVAMEQFKGRTGKRFPTFVDVLNVAKSLGYKKVAPAKKKTAKESDQ